MNRGVLIFLVFLKAGFLSAQEYSLQSLLLGRDVVTSYCEHMKALSYGDASKKVLIEDLWETVSNKMPNDIVRGGGRIELRKYLVNMQNNQVRLDYPDDPVMDESYFQNGDEMLFIFHTHKTLFDIDEQEFIIVSGNSNKIKNIYKEIPAGLVPQPIGEMPSNTVEETSSDDGELVIVNTGPSTPAGGGSAADPDVTYDKSFEWLASDLQKFKYSSYSNASSVLDEVILSRKWKYTMFYSYKLLSADNCMVRIQETEKKVTRQRTSKNDYTRNNVYEFNLQDIKDVILTDSKSYRLQGISDQSINANYWHGSTYARGGFLIQVDNLSSLEGQPDSFINNFKAAISACK